MALILDDDSLLDAADGFAGWDDALVDDTLAQELEQERAAELESELEQDERPIDYDFTTRTGGRGGRSCPHQREAAETGAAGRGAAPVGGCRPDSGGLRRCGGGMEQARSQS